jgi:hypothetical protein
MTTLFSVYNAQGKCVSYCNARCYNAKPISELAAGTHEGCGCCCGGKNHSVGEAQALKNFQQGTGMRPQDLKAFAKHRGLDLKTLTVVDRLHIPLACAKEQALAQLAPKKPLPLFAYGLVGHRKPTEDAQRRRG